ncbi:hypothetical protein B0T24DRAFT_674539 [Lasiosphaeria ovina]|uniref:Uncharacterized protein n=1 Tax=Lasiosphaeria ovina TaxID=92902 RepID=A0AAE0KM04_9PEZI|nr:hypothetical protein B0T24DRAFT_674539 [Lasiosphaeria ovina]
MNSINHTSPHQSQSRPDTHSPKIQPFQYFFLSVSWAVFFGLVIFKIAANKADGGDPEHLNLSFTVLAGVFAVFSSRYFLAVFGSMLDALVE